MRFTIRSTDRTFGRTDHWGTFADADAADRAIARIRLTGRLGATDFSAVPLPADVTPKPLHKSYLD